MVIAGITLPNPEWGDSQTNAIRSVQLHMSRSGYARTYIKKGTRLTVSCIVRYSSYDDIMALYQVLQDGMHSAINITDWNSVSWTNCYILDDILDVTNVGRAGLDESGVEDLGSELYELKFKFEGTKS